MVTRADYAYGPPGEIRPSEGDGSIHCPNATSGLVRVWELYRSRWPALYRPVSMFDPFERELTTLVNGTRMDEGDFYPEGSGAVSKGAGVQPTMQALFRLFPYRRGKILVVRRPPIPERHGDEWFIRCRMGVVAIADLLPEHREQVEAFAAVKVRSSRWRPKYYEAEKYANWEDERE